MATDMTDIGKRIREVRKRKRPKFTQADLGEALGVTASSVSSYESGEYSPTLESLVKIAEIGNVSLDWLITGKEPAPRVAEQPSEYVRGQSLNEDEKRFVIMLRRIPQHRKREVLDKLTGHYIDTMEAVEFEAEGKEGNSRANGNG